MMERRRFLLTSLVGGLAAPLVVKVRRAGNVPRISVLVGASPAPTHPIEGFRQGLRDLGYVPEQNIKTAKALGLTIPSSLLARADQVIE